MNNVRIGALGPESRALVREVCQTTPPRLAENPCRIGGDPCESHHHKDGLARA